MDQPRLVGTGAKGEPRLVPRHRRGSTGEADDARHAVRVRIGSRSLAEGLPRKFQLRARTTFATSRYRAPRPSSPARFIRIAMMAQHAANSASSGDEPHKAVQIL